MVELEGRHAIINTLPHLGWQTNGILQNQLFLLEEHRKRVRGNDVTPGQNKLHKLR